VAQQELLRLKILQHLSNIIVCIYAEKQKHDPSYNSNSRMNSSQDVHILERYSKVAHLFLPMSLNRDLIGDQRQVSEQVKGVKLTRWAWLKSRVRRGRS